MDEPMWRGGVPDGEPRWIIAERLTGFVGSYRYRAIYWDGERFRLTSEDRAAFNPETLPALFTFRLLNANAPVPGDRRLRLTPSGRLHLDKVEELARAGRRHGFCEWCFRPRPCFDMCESKDHGYNLRPTPSPLHGAVLRAYWRSRG